MRGAWTTQLRGLKQQLVNMSAALHGRDRLRPGASPRPRLTIVFLYAETDRYASAHDDIRAIQAHLRDLDCTLIRVNNFAKGPSIEQVADREYDVSGDNTSWEFSGWRRGVELIDTLCPDTTHVLCANDAFRNLEGPDGRLSFYENRFNVANILELGRRAAGKVHRNHGHFTVLGHDVTEFMVTNIFMLPVDIARRVRWDWIDPDRFRSMSPESFTGSLFLPGAPVNEEYQVWLEQWLACRWQRKSELNESTWPLLRMKLMAILNERLLTVDIRLQGAEVCGFSPTRVGAGRSRLEARLGPLEDDDVRAAAPREALAQEASHG